MHINLRLFYRLDWRMILVISALMVISLLIISSTDFSSPISSSENFFFTPKTVAQIKRIFLGWGVFLLFALMDYNKIREWAWILYLLMVVALLGLFFTPAIQNVHRWYRIPLIGISLQPSEYAKLIVVIALSWFLEKNKSHAASLGTACGGCAIVGIPFLLILKQPDLGTALVLCPVTLIMFYLGGLHRGVMRCMTLFGTAALVVITLIFSGVISHEKMRPYALQWMKEYQYERLNPHNHHQWAAQTAIGVGGILGEGWKSSEFTGRGWLPYAHTDSVFPAFGEEFGLLGLLVLLVLFYALIYLGFQVTVHAKDDFGKLLSAGVTVYLAMHILVNIGMMCGLLPITGVPLILVSYGGSSIFSTMAALGILQSIYVRRFMF